MQKKVVYHGGRAGHIVQVAPKKGYPRWVPHRYHKSRERED